MMATAATAIGPGCEAGALPGLLLDVRALSLDVIDFNARAALEVAEAPAADVSAEAARLAAHPDDHEARYAIAQALLASGDRDRAADELLEIIARDKEWNEGAARQRFLERFTLTDFAQRTEAVYSEVLAN